MAQRPPATPRRRKSSRTWLWVLLGCGGLILIGGVVVVGGGLMLVTNWIMGVQVSEAEVRANLQAVVPIYPGAEYDQESSMGLRVATEAGKAVVGAFGDDTEFPLSAAGAFSTEDSAEQVLEWYDEQMADAGWKKMPTGASGIGTTGQASYSKEGTMVIVQTQNGAGGKTTIMLMVMENLLDGAAGGELPAAETVEGAAD